MPGECATQACHVWGTALWEHMATFSKNTTGSKGDVELEARFCLLSPLILSSAPLNGSSLGAGLAGRSA